MMDYKCKNCWNKDIVLQEYMWAYDWFMSYSCDKCNKHYHRSWLEIIDWYQVEPYWPVYFTLEWNIIYKNLLQIEN
jgi:DNA-directed RNA polymerase subunit RPC12/RpoP